MGPLLVIIGTIALTFGTAVLKGWVLTKLWVWFIIPIFHLPVLGIAQAIGISLIMHYLTNENPDRKDDRKWFESVATAVVMPFIVLLMGWIVTLFL